MRVGETAGFHTCARCWLVGEGPVRLYSGCDPRRALGRRQQHSWVWPLAPGSQLQAFKMLLVVCLSSPLVKCKMIREHILRASESVCNLLHVLSCVKKNDL